MTSYKTNRTKILSYALSGKLTFKEASLALGLSYRHTLRLKEKLKNLGLIGLQRTKPKKPPNLKITPELRNTIISLTQKYYFDFNVLHFRDKLIENYGINLIYKSLRKLLIIEEGLHEPRKKRKVYRRRRRMSKAGMLVQMDVLLQLIHHKPKVG
ncbi:helix-turn-helix domain-containing protein [Thermodesulfobacterium sp. TA1]|uniref:helix-turn-helix domain-containing protein n=1 Tax=Thermodesulfobacterium sp. TA1 TaxID=2234087 RepID=UPI001231C33C|nr:helix-turn-helix domain-containing protein [Thermodesulfobacterium sp. TA1]QER42003.1 helix-turn-helix domain-containing protein [Thermodesulfobacterium sp. TA1]